MFDTIITDIYDDWHVKFEPVNSDEIKITKYKGNGYDAKSIYVPEAALMQLASVLIREKMVAHAAKHVDDFLKEALSQFHFPLEKSDTNTGSYYR